MRIYSLAVVCTVLLSGCSTISDWFSDEEEIAVRRLQPIEPLFTPTILWEDDLGSGVGHYYSRLEPALAYGNVYAANRQGLVAAYDQKTGKEVWSRNFAIYPDTGLTSGLKKLWSNGLPAKISGGVSIAYETVFIGTENGEVIALDAKTGELKWQVSVKGEVIAAPAIDEGVVVLNTGSGMVFALDASSGETVWTYESEVPPLSLRGVSSPAAIGGGAIIGTATGKLVVNILSSGQTAWEQVITSASGVTELERIVDIDSQPLVAAGTIYVITYDGSLAAVEMRSGRVIWKRDYKSYRRLTMAGSTLFLVDSNSNVYALDARNGVELWSQGKLKQRLLTSAVPVGEYLVAGDKYGFLHWFNQSDGKIVSRIAVGDDDEDESIYSAPVVEGNVIYTQTRDGKLVAVQTP
ncbi:outer membrane protein assembly factor BamB [Paraglaciecola sp.]|uniref:outer membrane protein assembly factor BamB n=1 Tax=Pseudomonadati TaxID=3379134 RepID=UPI00273EFC11|nr:outer membrane protein assembly factor BamB [Paraglaciecola sp.]MDP5028960.1 outer membrane protein assembly factor BamB [Paraglaciecola sp.]